MNTIAVNQKYWKLFKNATVSTSYLSVYLASCTDNDNCVSIDVDEIAEMLKVPRLELQDAVELLTQLSVMYPAGDNQYVVNPYYIWAGQLSSPEHVDKCRQWDMLVQQNPQGIDFCKKSPKSISTNSFMNISETLEILASSIITNSSIEG